MDGFLFEGMFREAVQVLGKHPSCQTTAWAGLVLRRSCCESGLVNKAVKAG